MALSLTRSTSRPRSEDDRDGRGGDSTSDDALVARARAGDADAFDALGRRHLPRTYALLFRIVGNHEDAEDLAQEASVRAWESLGLYRSGNFAAWLARIAIHLARDQHRRVCRRPRSRSLDEFRPEESAKVCGAQACGRPAPRSAGPPEVLAQRELARHLRTAVDELPFALKSAFCLRVLDGRSYEEIAELCGVTAPTARTQVMKARRRLETRLAAWLPNGGGER